MGGGGGGGGGGEVRGEVNALTVHFSISVQTKTDQTWANVGRSTPG